MPIYPSGCIHTRQLRLVFNFCLCGQVRAMATSNPSVTPLSVFDYDSKHKVCLWRKQRYNTWLYPDKSQFMNTCMWSTAVDHACKAQHYKMKQRQNTAPSDSLTISHAPSCVTKMPKLQKTGIIFVLDHLLLKIPNVSRRQFHKTLSNKRATCKPMWLLFTSCCMLVIRQCNFMNYCSLDWQNHSVLAISDCLPVCHSEVTAL